MSVVNITSENFEEEVANSNIPVLLDFWANWCGHCQTLSPTIDEIATQLQGEVKVGKINIDEQQKIAQAFNVESIPTLMVINNGKLINQAVGARSKEEILKMVQF